jgi:hypothetical protein
VLRKKERGRESERERKRERERKKEWEGEKERERERERMQFLISPLNANQLTLILAPYQQSIVIILLTDLTICLVKN